MRALGIVALFVLLNAIGFIAYRTFSTVDVSASNLPASTPVNEPSIAQPVRPDQPKDGARTPAQEFRAEPAAPAAPSTTTEPTTTEPTSTSSAEGPAPASAAAAADPVQAAAVAAPPPHPRASQRARGAASPVRRAGAPVPSTARAAPPAPPAPPAAVEKPAKPPVEPDRLLEMEPNPYKRGE
jgi:hypothetical protein